MTLDRISLLRIRTLYSEFDKILHEGKFAPEAIREIELDYLTQKPDDAQSNDILSDSFIPQPKEAVFIFAEPVDEEGKPLTALELYENRLAFFAVLWNNMQHSSACAKKCKEIAEILVWEDGVTLPFLTAVLDYASEADKTHNNADFLMNDGRFASKKAKDSTITYQYTEAPIPDKHLVSMLNN